MAVQGMKMVVLQKTLTFYSFVLYLYTCNIMGFEIRIILSLLLWLQFVAMVSEWYYCYIYRRMENVTMESWSMNDSTSPLKSRYDFR